MARTAKDAPARMGRPKGNGRYPFKQVARFDHESRDALNRIKAKWGMSASHVLRRLVEIAARDC
jgi:hypothetical protein